MGTYFKPWRRRIGVLLLLTACVFAGAWVRSRFATDSAWMCFESYQRFILTSAEGSLCLEIGDPVDVDRTLKPVFGYGYWTGKRTIGASMRFGYDLWTLIGYYRAERFVQAKRGFVPNRTIDQPVLYLFFEYWKFAIPLTLLSAWLLLSKPRAKKTTTESPPVSEKA